MNMPVQKAERVGLRAVLADRWLIWGIGAGLVLRALLVLGLDDGMSLIGDEYTYFEYARRFLDTGDFETGNFVRPPLFFLFVAATGSLFDEGSWHLATRLVQCAASVATAIPIYRSAHRIGGVRAARLAAMFALFDPTLIAFSHLLWPETLFLLLVAIVFDGVVDLDERSWGRSCGLGALTGLAMLLKPVFGLFTLFLAASWLRRFGFWRAAAIALVFGSTAAAVIAPWVIRNQFRYGPTIVLENQGPYNLWIGNSDDRPRRILNQWRAIPDPVSRSRIGTERGVAAIKSDPERFVRKAVSRSVNLWGLEYFAVRQMVVGGYGPVSRDTFLTVFWVIQLAWVVSLSAAALGLTTVARDPTLRLILYYTLTFTVLVSAMVATTRFRIPFAFWIAIASGVGVDRALDGKFGRRVLAPLCVVALLLVSSASRPMFQRLITADFEKPTDMDKPRWRFFRY
jgi:4-amino-4-deoxy-L-arabinose transferase-like glycosyltransferase